LPAHARVFGAQFAQGQSMLNLQVQFFKVEGLLHEVKGAGFGGLDRQRTVP